MAPSTGGSEGVQAIIFDLDVRWTGWYEPPLHSALTAGRAAAADDTAHAAAAACIRSASAPPPLQGTIIDTESLVLEVVRCVIESHGKTLTAEAATQALGMRPAEAWEAVARTLGIPASGQQLYEQVGAWQPQQRVQCLCAAAAALLCALVGGAACTATKHEGMLFNTCACSTLVTCRASRCCKIAGTRRRCCQ